MMNCFVCTVPVFFLMIRRPPRSTRTDTLFPYTTLFRSQEFRRILRGPLPADLCLDRAAAVVRSAFHFAHHRILFRAGQRTMHGAGVCARTPRDAGLSVFDAGTASGTYALGYSSRSAAGLASVKPRRVRATKGSGNILGWDIGARQ